MLLSVFLSSSEAISRSISAFTDETKDLCFLDVKVQARDDLNRIVYWTKRDVKSLDRQEGHSRLLFLFFKKPEISFRFL